MKPRSPLRNRWGTFFLVFATAGFAVSTFVPWPFPGVLRFVQAFFEASLVGALADWFAVTALFKKPLGLPLPHTDLLVRRKDQLVEALPQFLGSFLVPQTIHPVLQAVDWAALVLEKVDPPALDDLVQEGLRTLLAADNPARKAWEQQAIGLGATLLHRELTQHRDSLVGPMTEIIKRNAGWKGVFIGRDTIDEAVEGFLAELLAVRDNPAHGLRRYLAAAFRDALPRLADELRPSRWTSETWKRLEADQGFRHSFNTKAGAFAVALWEKTQAADALTGALRYLLTQTDARSLANRIEASVAHDLQYIRVNGALVGGLAGVLLEGLRSLLG